MSKNWPFWHTESENAASVTNRGLFWVGLATFLIPFIVCVPILLGINEFGLPGVYLIRLLAFVPITVVYGAYFSWAFIIVATLIARLALHKGYAGWGVALRVGIALPLGVFAWLPDSGLFSRSIMITHGVGSGIGHAALFWLIVRLKSPAAFSRSPQ